jgi:sulfite reductase (ferredoxin)
VSGCFNSCGQHHVADLGFYGVSRNVNGYTVPHFQVILGGNSKENVASYGLPVGAVPSKRIPEVVLRVTDRFVREHKSRESFQEFIDRIGKKEVKAMLADLIQVPPHEQDPSMYRDWGDPREFSLVDMGVGECAGEVVSQTQFTLAASEREFFEAQISFDAGNFQQALAQAYKAMVQAAEGLLKMIDREIPTDEDTVLAEFTRRLCDTQIFYDKYAGGKFAEYLFKARDALGTGEKPSNDIALRRLQEAQLFIDAAHACHDRLQQKNGRSERVEPAREARV